MTRGCVPQTTHTLGVFRSSLHTQSHQQTHLYCQPRVHTHREVLTQITPPFLGESPSHTQPSLGSIKPTQSQPDPKAQGTGIACPRTTTPRIPLACICCTFT